MHIGINFEYLLSYANVVCKFQLFSLCAQSSCMQFAMRCSWEKVELLEITTACDWNDRRRVYTRTRVSYAPSWVGDVYEKNENVTASHRKLPLLQSVTGRIARARRIHPGRNACLKLS